MFNFYDKIQKKMIKNLRYVNKLNNFAAYLVCAKSLSCVGV